MDLNQIPIQTGHNYTAVNLGVFTQLHQYVYQAPGIPFAWEGKVFLQQLLNLTSGEISLNKLSPQSSIPFYHKHRENEEVYIFVGGEGEFQVDGNIFPIGEGSVIRVAPDGERCLRNSSTNEDLCWIVIQSRVNSHEGGTIEDGYRVKKAVTWVKEK